MASSRRSVLPQPQRIHIIGGSGSGKTRLARELSARLGIPFHELDVVAYEGGAGAKRPFDARQRELRAITAQPAWITEGSYVGWIEELVKSADLIVWLDLHWTICYRRVVMRHIKADLARNNRHPGFLRMLRFAQGVRPYYCDTRLMSLSGPEDDGSNRAAVAALLASFPERTLRLRHPREVRRFVRNLK
jgi:shikimate kinase